MERGSVTVLQSHVFDFLLHAHNYLPKQKATLTINKDVFNGELLGESFGESFHPIANIVQHIENIAMRCTIIVTSQAITMVDFLALQI